jgi:hypothetical protein
MITPHDCLKVHHSWLVAESQPLGISDISKPSKVSIAVRIDPVPGVRGRWRTMVQPISIVRLVAGI